MRSKIDQGIYRGARAVVLENALLKVTLVPGMGGKIASIIYKPLDSELLWQNSLEKFVESEYDSPFSDGDMSGMDDMFPTIDECFYPDGPWKGTRLPDHGEVWALPWASHIHGTAVTLSVFGVRIPYRLSKIVSLSEGKLDLRYSLKNLSPFDFKFIWALHPLFKVDEFTRIVLPESVKRVINVGNSPLRLGAYGSTHSWPITKHSSGEIYDMSRILPPGKGNYDKYYVQGSVPEGRCALYNERSGMEIGLTFSPEKVPFLGMWINEGAYHAQYNVAPEPCTGAFDRVDIAAQWGAVSTIPAMDTYEWQIGMDVKQR
ncbi:hypothetical protein CEB3_c11710 [Peptococcaceae bacterium CEB3]|nr:hypothetical protein CEB3_c11710 [Peptococcaceae bacterium CEB3]